MKMSGLCYRLEVIPDWGVVKSSGDTTQNLLFNIACIIKASLRAGHLLECGESFYNDSTNILQKWKDNFFTSL
jgi:hypothetical protein